MVMRRRGPITKKFAIYEVSYLEQEPAIGVRETSITLSRDGEYSIESDDLQ
jgi:hypothetical protein